MNPKQLSNLLFSDLPKDPHSISILDNDKHQFEPVELSELLINILFYGLEIMHDDFKTINIDDLSSDDFNALSPWFESMGYKVNSNEYNIQSYKDGELFGLYYAKIVLNQGNNKFFFKNSDLEDFRFIFNGDIDIQNPPFNELNEFKYLLLTTHKAILLSFSNYHLEL